MQAIMPILIDASLKGLAMLLLAALVTAAMRKSSAAARHLVWTAAVVAVLAMPLLSVLLPGLSVLPERIPGLGSGERASLAAAPDQAEGPAQAADETASQPMASSTPLEPVGDDRSAGAADGPWGAASHEPGNPVTAGEQRAPSVEQSRNHEAAGAPAGTPADRWSSRTWLNWLPWIWLGGAGFALIPLALGWLSLWHLRRTSEPVTASGGGSWRMLLHQLQAQIGLRRPVVLLKSPCRTMPMTWGGGLAGWLPGTWGKAKVLIPEDASEWSLQRRRAVLLHELAHVQRRDCLTQMLTQVACALYWFNPLVWYAAHRMLIERERACDDLVLMHATKASDYAQHLLDIATGPQAGLFAAHAGIAMARRSKLDGRLVAILDQHRNRRAMSRLGVALAITLIGAVALTVACVQVSRPQPFTSATVNWQYDPETPPIHAPFTLHDSEQVQRLTDHFPDAGSRRRSHTFASAIPNAIIEFRRTDGSMVTINATYEIWGEGNGVHDWPVRGNLRQTLRDLAADGAEDEPSPWSKAEVTYGGQLADEPPSVLRVTLDDPEQVVKLASYFPRLGKPRQGRDSAGWDGLLKITFHAVDDESIQVEASVVPDEPHHSLWREHGRGGGDYLIHDPAGLVAFLEQRMTASEERSVAAAERFLDALRERNTIYLAVNYPPAEPGRMDRWQAKLSSLVEEVHRQTDPSQWRIGQHVERDGWALVETPLQEEGSADDMFVILQRQEDGRWLVREFDDWGQPGMTLGQRLDQFRERVAEPAAGHRDTVPSAPAAANLAQWLEGKEIVEVTFAGPHMDPQKLRDSLDRQGGENDQDFRLKARDGGVADRTFVSVSMRVTPENVERLLALQDELTPRGYALDPEATRVLSYPGDPEVRAEARQLVPEVLAAVQRQIDEAVAGVAYEMHEPAWPSLGSVTYRKAGDTLGRLYIDEISTIRRSDLLAPRHDQQFHMPHLGLLIWVYGTPTGMPQDQPESPEHEAVRQAVRRAVAPLLTLEAEQAEAAEPDVEPEAVMPQRPAVNEPVDAAAGEAEDGAQEPTAWRDAESEALVGAPVGTAMEEYGPPAWHASAEPVQGKMLAGHFWDLPTAERPRRVLVVREEPRGDEAIEDAYWAIAGHEGRAFHDPPPAATQFGPVIERTLEDVARTRQVLDLDTGRLIEVPDSGRMWGPVFDRMTASGAELYYGTRGGREDLWAAGLVADAWPGKSFDEVTAMDVIAQAQLQPAQYGQDARSNAPLRVSEQPPGRVYFVRTREGAMGVFQATGFTEDPIGVQLRYKLLQGPVPDGPVVSARLIEHSTDEGAYKLRTSISREPVKLVHGWYRVTTGDQPRLDGWGSLATGPAGTESLSLDGSVAVVNGRLQLSYRLYRTLEPVPAFVDMNYSDPADGELRRIVFNDELRHLTDQYQPLYRVEIERDGEHVQTIYHVARVVAEGDDARFTPPDVDDDPETAGEPAALADLPLAWGEAVQDLQVGLAVPERPMVFRIEQQRRGELGVVNVLVREPFPVRWAIRNVGDQERTIVWHELHYSPVLFEIGEPGGEKDLRSDPRRMLHGRIPGPPEPVELEPGEVHEAVFDLARFLRNDTEPGVYEVTGLYVPKSTDPPAVPAEYLARPEFNAAVLDRIASPTVQVRVQPEPEDGAAAAPAFDRLTLTMRSTWAWNRRIVIDGDGRYRYLLEPAFPEQQELYETQYRLQPEHRRELANLLAATDGLGEPTVQDERIDDAVEFGLTLVQDDQTTTATARGDQPEEYEHLIRFLRRIDRQEWLLYQASQGERERRHIAHQLHSELEAVQGEPHTSVPYAPVLDYRRLLPVYAPALREPAEHPQIAVHTAIRLVRQLEDRQYVDALVDLARHDDWRGSEAVAQALVALQGEEAIPTLRAMLPDVGVAWTLVQFGEPAVPTIMAVIEEASQARELGDEAIAAGEALVRAYLDHWEQVEQPIDPRVIEAVRQFLSRQQGTGVRTQYHQQLLQRVREREAGDRREGAEERAGGGVADAELGPMVRVRARVTERNEEQNPVKLEMLRVRPLPGPDPRRHLR